MTKQFDAVIYDMDGLIIDTEPFWWKAEIKVFGTVGVHITEADCHRLSGYRFDEVVNYWYNRHSWKNKTREQVHDEVIDEMEYAITHFAKEMKGVHASLEYFKGMGLRIGLASSSAMRLIKAVVTKLKIEDYFEILVSAEHEKYGKPHPAVFIRTAERMEIEPETCLVLEDSFNGLLAAKAARMKCALIPEKSNFNDPRFAIADWKLNSLEEIKTIIQAP